MQGLKHNLMGTYSYHKQLQWSGKHKVLIKIYALHYSLTWYS